MSEKIKQMAERFLQWKLPADFNPDGGISFKAGSYEPTGTNLFSYTQAEAMVRHIMRDPQMDAAVEALRKIVRNEITVPDEDLSRDVIVSMDTEEMVMIAESALAQIDAGRGGER